MAKRGRPPKPEEESGIHKKSYYKLSPKRERLSDYNLKKKRILDAYENLFLLAYGFEYKEMPRAFREDITKYIVLHKVI